MMSGRFITASKSKNSNLKSYENIYTCQKSLEKYIFHKWSHIVHNRYSFGENKIYLLS